MTETRRHDAIAIAILAAIATLLFVDVLIGTHNFYLRDLSRYYYPAKHVVRQIVLDGEFPYWNRYFSAGQPIAANPEHEVFYPLTWLILLPSFDLGYRLHILVHVYIGIFGMYALLRSMALRAPAAAFGAISFAIGGVYLSYVNLLPIFFCAAWIPLTCLYARKFMLTPRLRYFALASLFFGMQLLVAEPTTILQTGFLLGTYALYRGWYAARDAGLPWTRAIPEMLTRVLFVGLISLAALAIGAAQMLPAIDHAADSVRSRPFAFDSVADWHMPAVRLVELIYPNFLGYITFEGSPYYWGRGLWGVRTSPFLYSIYGGLAVIALAIGAIFVKPRGGRFVFLLCAFAVVIALGPETPLLRVLFDTGLLTSIRYLEKFFLIASFALVVFGAQMFQRLLDGDRALRRAAAIFAAGTAVLAAVFAVRAFAPDYARDFGLFWGVKEISAQGASDLARKTWVIAALRGAALTALLLTVGTARRRLWLAFALAFLVLDLAPVGNAINPRMPSSFYLDEPAVVRESFPSGRDQFRIFHDADWKDKTDPEVPKYLATGKMVYWIVRNGIFPVVPARYRLATVMDRDYDKTALLPTVDFVASMFAVKNAGRADWWQPFAAMSNVWYRSEYRPFKEESKRTKGRMKEVQPVDFVEVTDHPRYYFSDQMVTIRTRGDFVRKLTKETFSPRVAFVPMSAFQPAAGVVHAWRETANTARIEVESEGKGFLVMSVTPHKYWRVTLDGKPVRPVLTNIGYQGIVVPKGPHTVEMVYRNDRVRTGLIVSIVATALLLLGAAVPERRTSVATGRE